MRNKIYIFFTLLIAAVLVYGVYSKEALLKSDNVFYLKLAPVDPRSLMQGDYMILNYDINRDLRYKDYNAGAKILLKKDSYGVASYKGLYDGRPLEEGELIVTLVRVNSGFFEALFSNGTLSVAPAGFMFQEGHAKKYEEARYALLKAAPSGTVLLTGLADGSLKEIR